MERFFRILLPKPPLPETSSPPALRFIFPAWERYLPSLGTLPSQHGSVSQNAGFDLRASESRKRRAPVAAFLYREESRAR